MIVTRGIGRGSVGAAVAWGYALAAAAPAFVFPICLTVAVSKLYTVVTDVSDGC